MTVWWTSHTSRNQMSYDDLCKLVNDAYWENPDIRIRTLANDLGIPFDIVWECLGFRDWFDFVETGEDWMEGLIGLIIIGWCVWMLLRHPLKSLSFLFKIGFLLVLGFGAFLVLWWVLLTVWQRTPYRRTDNTISIYTCNWGSLKNIDGGCQNWKGYAWNFPINYLIPFSGTSPNTP